MDPDHEGAIAAKFCARGKALSIFERPSLTKINAEAIELCNQMNDTTAARAGRTLFISGQYHLVV
jgi:hypothetical protein